MVETEKIILKPSQEKALKELIDWCGNKSSLEYTLTGRAGTGKTTLLKAFIDECKIPKWCLCITAPTHKAKKVVSKKTGIAAETIQKLLGLRPNTELENFNINRPQFEMLSEVGLVDYQLVIIDEASMLNKDLYTYLIKEAEKHRVKLLFVGDDAQINPVKETISPIFKVKDKSVLTEVIRQSGENPVMELFEILTNDIDNNTDNHLKFLRDNPKRFNEKGEGYECLSMEDFKSKMIDYYSSNDFKQNPDYCKYIAWTNRSINGLNNYIRENIIKTKNILEVGELLMAYSSLTDKIAGPILVNSDDYIVKDIKELTNEYNIKGYVIKLESETLFSNIFIVDPIQSNIENFLEPFNKLLDTAQARKGRAWRDFYEFKERHLLIKDIIDVNGKLICKKDIDYGYGLTSHKSQGSTYNNIFINLNDIMMNNKSLERKRLTYVALSRMTDKAFILY